MYKLRTEQLLKVYEDAVKYNLSRDFIMLLSEELLKRNITFQLNDFGEA